MSAIKEGEREKSVRDRKKIRVIDLPETGNVFYREKDVQVVETRVLKLFKLTFVLEERVAV